MKPLRSRMIEDMQIRNLAVDTQQAYVQQVSLFAQYFNKSPELLGPEQIRTYQLHLINEKKLSTSSILVATAALRFVYKVTLKRPWSFDDLIPVPKKPQKLPVILSPDEVLHFLNCVEKRKYRAILTSAMPRACASPRLLLSPQPPLTANGWSSGSNRVREKKIGTPCCRRSSWTFSGTGGEWSGRKTGSFRATWAYTSRGARLSWSARRPAVSRRFRNPLSRILFAMRLQFTCWNKV